MRIMPRMSAIPILTFCCVLLFFAVPENSYAQGKVLSAGPTPKPSPDSGVWDFPVNSTIKTVRVKLFEDVENSPVDHDLCDGPDFGHDCSLSELMQDPGTVFIVGTPLPNFEVDGWYVIGVPQLSQGAFSSLISDPSGVRFFVDATSPLNPLIRFEGNGEMRFDTADSPLPGGDGRDDVGTIFIAKLSGYPKTLQFRNISMSADVSTAFQTGNPDSFCSGGYPNVNELEGGSVDLVVGLIRNPSLPMHLATTIRRSPDQRFPSGTALNVPYSSVSSLVENSALLALMWKAEICSDFVPSYLGHSEIVSLELGVGFSQRDQDYDGDGQTDLSIFRPQPSSLVPNGEGSTSQWWLLFSRDLSTLGITFGQPTDQLSTADFTGDGKTDVAFFRPSTGEWFVLRSEDMSFFAFPFGVAEDIPAPGDFDGDGIADPAVYRPSSGTWYILNSSDSSVIAIPFGIPEDVPTVADYDGDGMDDIAVYRPSLNQWWQLRSTAGIIAYEFGSAGDVPAVGDHTGDGKADVAFYRPSTSEWYVIRSEDSTFYAFPWGTPGDVPVPGDFDGDGVHDAAVWRESDGTWYINGSFSGFRAIPFGAAGDVPLP